MEGQQINKVNITAAEFAAKFQSKREVYRFLSSEAAIYLSSIETLSIYHLRDLVANKRKRIRCKEVKFISIPQFAGLSIKDLLAYAEGYEEVMRALPITKNELDKLPRQYIANIIYTIVGKPFYDWVEARVNLRNQNIKEENLMNIEMDDEIAKIF